MSIENYSTTTLFSQIFISILGIHMMLAERAIKIVKLNAIQRQYSSKELSLDLLLIVLH